MSQLSTAIMLGDIVSHCLLPGHNETC